MWCLLSILYLLSAQSPSKSLGNLEDPMPITLVLSPAHSVYYSTSMKWTSGRIASALTMLLNWWNNKLISWQCSSLIEYKNKATSLDISQTTCCMRGLNSASCHSTKTWFFLSSMWWNRLKHRCRQKWTLALFVSSCPMCDVEMSGSTSGLSLLRAHIESLVLYSNSYSATRSHPICRCVTCLSDNPLCCCSLFPWLSIPQSEKEQAAA